MQSCWRVTVCLYRKGLYGQLRIVRREGPIIAAESPDEALVKAQTIFAQRRDFAGLGEAAYLHGPHRGHQ